MAKKQKPKSKATGDQKSAKPVLDEIATVKNDIIQDYIGDTVLNPDKVLKSESGGKGIEFYEDLLRDSEVRSALQTRRLAVIGKEWSVDPASEDDADVEIAEFVKDAFLDCNFDSARQSLLSGIVLGYKPAEIMWEFVDGAIKIKEIIGKASRRFVFDTQGKLRLLTLQNMINGEEVPDRKFIVFRNVSDNGSYYGDGLGSSLYWHVWFRKNGIKFWAIFCDKFGSPTAVGKYPPGTTKEQQDALLAAIEAIQQESGIKIPDTMAIELLEATRAGSINTYESFCAYHDKAISKVLLGHSAATESTPGKLGNETQSVNIRQDYLKADADALCECLNNSLVRWLVDYNFPNVKAYPKVWIRTEPEKDLKPLADRDLVLARDLRLPVMEKYFYETYGIPQPEEGEKLIEIPAAIPTPNPSQEGNKSEIRSPIGSGTKSEMGGRQYAESVRAENFQPLQSHQQALDGLIEKTSSAAAKSLEANEQKILGIMESSKSYEEAREKLQGLNIDMKEFETLIERSALAGLVFGKYTIKTEIKPRQDEQD